MTDAQRKTHEFRAEAIAALSAAQERDLDRAANVAWEAGLLSDADATGNESFASANDAMRDFYRTAAEGR